MRAGKIFINDLLELGLLEKVSVGRFVLVTRYSNVSIGQDCKDLVVCHPPCASQAVLNTLVDTGP